MIDEKHIIAAFVYPANADNYVDEDGNSTVWQAIAGSQWLVRDGEDVTASATGDYNTDRHSRTCVGITEDGKVVFMVLDGRQEPFSCGGSMHELAQIMLEAGCVAAINLDGGGSTTYAARQEGSDTVEVINLLRHGLLKASYIPSREQRELREITRYRKSLTEERTREVNRLQKILEGANIKLDSVVKDITGKSARKLLQRIIDDDIPDSAEVSKLVHGRMRPKLDQIVASIEGITTPLQRKLLAQIIDHIDDLNRRIGELDKLVQEYMTEYEAAIAAIDEIPGIARRSAEVILAEIGLDMSRFPSAAHLCSWAGVCPGNYQSAGKRKHGKTTKGNSALKTILTQCAKSARSTKNSYFSAQYQRIAARRGKNRATLAVAHSILIAIYHILKNKAAFHDLGADYYDSFNRDRKINSYLKRLKALGWEPDAIPSSA